MLEPFFNLKKDGNGQEARAMMQDFVQQVGASQVSDVVGVQNSAYFQKSFKDAFWVKRQGCGAERSGNVCFRIFSRAFSKTICQGKKNRKITPVLPSHDNCD